MKGDLLWRSSLQRNILIGKKGSRWHREMDYGKNYSDQPIWLLAIICRFPSALSIPVV